ncbi:M16 family metallopeptidase [Tautonia plasticadhaerens]|uniref:Peptidase M16 inactive domain protein n=1 Tax=Tautonia plasticadhaerens TaxID=2527974 RepID=A0A518H1Y3_9BACT|nr:pitrilysin family protein [Tautonia plasticadhaerens]QDV34856.1 Peptidase M16 inactive domain protein [Tautonia plasticadhaerens]
MQATRRGALIAALVLVGAGPATAAPQDEPRRPQIPDLGVETYALPNGLEVILHEDHTIPVVAVNVWYKVGSKDEAEGRTGFAHLFEHLMFQGSQNLEGEYFAPLEPIGADLNGSTNTDRTNYYEVVPSNALELALWLEADRMGFLLPTLTQESLDNQRDVVKNERRQRIDNVPYGQVQERILGALYPGDHPYHHSVIGSMEDLSAATLDDVKNFFRRYYNPNNASLCLAGDFDPAEAKALIEKYFGPIPAGPEPEPIPTRVPTLDVSVDLAITDRVSLPRVYLSWPTVPQGHPDEQALDVLGDVLGQLDKESRLEKAMVYDEPLASQVFAYHGADALSGTFAVIATGRPDGVLDDLVAVIDREIARLQREGATPDEVLKSQNTTESGLVFGLQDVGTRADFFNSNNVNFGDPLAYRDRLQELFDVTAEDVRRVANQYLTPDRVRMDVTPGSPTPRPPEVASNAARDVEFVAEDPAIEDAFDRSIQPGTGEAPEFSPPPVERRALENGLEVLVVSRPQLPILTMDLVVKGGGALVPEAKDGVAELLADLLTEGTADKDAQELAGALSRIGASIYASAGIEAMTVSLSTLTKHTDDALDLFAEVVLNPAFRDADLERQRDLLLAGLLRQRDSATSIADNVFPILLYGESHPYGRPVEGTLETVPSITRDDVAAFHSLLFRPNNAALIVVGDTTADAIVDRLERSPIGRWAPGEVPAFNLPEPAPSPAGTLYLVDRPESAQSVLSVGEIGLPRDTPDYFPATLLNAVFGGQFSSRINLNLREDKGYTYGARSGFSFRKGAGPFSAGASVQTAVTAPALSELHRELVEITGDRPVTEQELADARGKLVLGFPGDFETAGSVASQLEALVLYGLPDDYFTTYQDALEAVTLEQVREAATRHLHPGKMTMLVVGDRDAIASELESLPFVPSITLRDPQGDPVESADGAESEGGR